MLWEDPDQLLLMKLGREEYCQRMLTSLIIGGPYPKWNSKNIPSENGIKFLKGLHHLAFGSDIEKPIEFIDEFDLPGKSLNERGGAPDYAVFWDNHLWIIELKTESSSHRNGQLPQYLELAKHHFSNLNLQMLYITPSMVRIESAGPDNHSFSHLFWSVSPLINRIWSVCDKNPERLLESALQRELLQLNSPLKVFRDNAEVIRHALNLSLQVQETGKQMAVELKAGGLDEIIELRIRIRDALKRSEGANNVKPWIWFEKSSGGKPITELGKQVGCELRLSRYRY
jgi:hypothetical protein